MKGRVIFTKESAKPNIHISLPLLIEQGDVELDNLVKQYSQIRLKPSWMLKRKNGKVVAVDRGLYQPFMEAITGDESPFSYLQAALLYHDLANYESDDPVLIGDMILDDKAIQQMDMFGYWNFGQLDRSLNPLFFYDSLLHPVVIWFTHHREGVEHIVKHIHRFDHVYYTMKYHHRTWAVTNKLNPHSGDPS